MQTKEDNLLDHSPLPTTQWLKMEQESLTPVSPNYTNLVWAESIITSLFIILLSNIIAIFVNLPGFIIIGITTCLILLLSALAIFRNQQAKRLAYGVTKQELLLQQGLIWRKRVSLPYSRLQHVSLNQGPLERHYGLKQLKCFSAGSGHAEIDLRGLDTVTAEQLRQHLLLKAGLEVHSSKLASPIDVKKPNEEAANTDA